MTPGPLLRKDQAAPIQKHGAPILLPEPEHLPRASRTADISTQHTSFCTRDHKGKVPREEAEQMTNHRNVPLGMSQETGIPLAHYTHGSRVRHRNATIHTRSSKMLANLTFEVEFLAQRCPAAGMGPFRPCCGTESSRWSTAWLPVCCVAEGRRAGHLLAWRS